MEPDTARRLIANVVMSLKREKHITKDMQEGVLSEVSGVPFGIVRATFEVRT